jgi:hypothetical protein
MSQNAAEVEYLNVHGPTVPFRHLLGLVQADLDRDEWLINEQQ